MKVILAPTIFPASPVAAPGALAGLSLSVMLSALGTSSANVGLPTLSQVFGVSFASAQWIVLAYLLALTTLIVSAGRLGDLAGRRRLLLVGLALFTLASFSCGLASRFWILLAARALQGLAAALLLTLSLALVGDAVPRAQTGRAMGLLGTMSAIGTALGPSLGGFLLAVWGWPALFLLNVPLGLVALLLVHRSLPEDQMNPASTPRSFDAPGCLLLGITLGAYALAMTTGHGHLGPQNLLLLLVAGIGLGSLILVESRTASPLFDLSLFREAPFRTSLGLSLLVSTVVMSALIVGPFYLSGYLGLSPAWVGLVLSVGPVVTTLTALPAGRLVDRFGSPPITLLGLVGLTLGTLALALLPGRLGLPAYLAPIVVLTAGYGLFQTANNTAVMAGVPPDRRGTISGLLNLSRQLGLITGASVMGLLFSLATATGNHSAPPADSIATGFRTTLAVAGILMLLGLAAARTALISKSS